MFRCQMIVPLPVSWIQFMTGIAVDAIISFELQKLDGLSDTNKFGLVIFNWNQFQQRCLQGLTPNSTILRQLDSMNLITLLEILCFILYLSSMLEG